MVEGARVNFFKIIAVIILMGNLNFAKDASVFASFASNGNAEIAEKVCRLLGVNMVDFYHALLALDSKLEKIG